LRFFVREKRCDDKSIIFEIFDRHEEIFSRDWRLLVELIRQVNGDIMPAPDNTIR
jgi:hypothetical protein